MSGRERRARHRRPDECREVARHLQRYLDGELDVDSAFAIVQHLEACLRCGLDAATYRELKRHLARMQRPLDAALMERLRGFVDDLTLDR